MPETAASPLPGLEHAFDLYVERGPALDVGQLAIGGRRAHVPVKGGVFSCGELEGELVGGSEILFERSDRVTVVEASYLIVTAGGAAMRATGQGYRTGDGDFVGTRLSLLLETDAEGPLAELAGAVFVGEMLPGEALLAVSRIV